MELFVIEFGIDNMEDDMNIVDVSADGYDSEQEEDTPENG